MFLRLLHQNLEMISPLVRKLQNILRLALIQVLCSVCMIAKEYQHQFGSMSIDLLNLLKINNLYRIMMQEYEENILEDFIDKMFDDMQDIPPEIMEIVDEYFFEMI